MSHDGEARDFAIQKSLGSDGAECALPMTMMDFEVDGTGASVKQVVEVVVVVVSSSK